MVQQKYLLAMHFSCCLKPLINPYKWYDMTVLDSDAPESCCCDCLCHGWSSVL